MVDLILLFLKKKAAIGKGGQISSNITTTATSKGIKRPNR
jgi:hypothetical protein